MNFELRHPQPPAPLLPAGQGGNLYGKGSDIVQGFDGADALLVHFGQAHDERLKRGSGVPLS